MSDGQEFLKRFFSFKAFRPDPRNPTLSLANRVGNKRIALVSVGPCGIKTATGRFTKKGIDISDVEYASMRIGEGAQDNPALAVCSKKGDDGLVAVCSGWRGYIYVDAARMTTDQELNHELITNPASILGVKYQASRRFMGFLSKDKANVVVADTEEETLQTLEDILSNQNLIVTRMQLGMLTLCNQVLKDPEVNDAPPNVIPLIHDHGHIALVMRGEKFTVRLFNSMIDVRPDSQTVDRATKLEERLTDFLVRYRAGKETEFLVADTEVPNIQKIMDNFCTHCKHDAGVTWKRYTPEGIDPGTLEFRGLMEN